MIGNCIGVCGRDPELRRICDIEEHEKPYHPSQLTRFRQRICPERLERIMDNIVGRLKNAGIVKGEVVACDATFLKAYSKRIQRTTLEVILTLKLGSEGLEKPTGLTASIT